MSYSKADSVYSAINGDYIDKEDYIIEGIEVANAFEDGSVCSKYYENIYNAKQRLFDRLNCKNGMDDDVDTIMVQWDALSRELASLMFEYGYMYGKKDKE